MIICLSRFVFVRRQLTLDRTVARRTLRADAIDALHCAARYKGKKLRRVGTKHGIA